MTVALPTTVDTFLDLAERSGVPDRQRLEACLERYRDRGEWPDEPKKLATLLVRDAVITYFQAEQLLQGRHRGFNMGNYRLLEKLGSGGMGSVFLSEHTTTRVRMALKILPRSVAAKPTISERFQREARAAEALNHPHVVRSYSLEQEGDIRYLVMEYVDGQDLRNLVKHYGPLEPKRAAHYIRQAAEGLDHVHSAGLIHRDLKPANLLLDRAGTVKLLDLGLARFVDDQDQLTRQQGEGTVLGTADYLSPEQAIDSHDVDQRTDIYSLGATIYFLLTGQSPVPDVPVHRKLIFIQTQTPMPLRKLRPEIPAELIAVVERMMAKAPADRFQRAVDVAKALEPWTRTPILPPKEEPQVRLSPLARGIIPSLDGADAPAKGFETLPTARLIDRSTESHLGRSGMHSSSDTFSSRVSRTATLSPAPASTPENAGRLPRRWLLPLIAAAFAGGIGFVLLIVLLWRFLA